MDCKFKLKSELGNYYRDSCDKNNWEVNTVYSPQQLAEKFDRCGWCLVTKLQHSQDKLSRRNMQIKELKKLICDVAGKCEFFKVKK